MRGSPALLLAAAALALTGCAFFAPPRVRGGMGAEGADAVRIGYVGSFSGTSAEYGGSARDGALMAVERINAAGGILGGRGVRLETRDDQSDTAPAVRGALDLYDAGVAAVIGTNASSSTAAVAVEAAKARARLLVSPSATSPLLTDPSQTDAGGWFFRTVPSDALQGQVMAGMLRDAGHARVAVIHVDAPYGTGFARRLESALGGATLVGYEETAEPKASYDDVLTKAFAGGPTAIVLIGYPGEASVMLNEWRASTRDQAVAWYFGDGLQAQSFVDNVTDRGAMEGRMGTAPYTDPAFIEAYQARYGRKPLFDAAGAYDAVMLLALAMEAAKSTDAAAVRAGLRGVSAGGEKFRPEAVSEVLAAVRAGVDVDYDGYAGPVDLDGRGDVTSGAYEVWTVKDAKIVATGEVRRP